MNLAVVAGNIMSLEERVDEATFAGRGRNPLLLLGEWTAVIKSRLCHTDLGMERESPLFFNYSAA